MQPLVFGPQRGVVARGWCYLLRRGKKKEKQNTHPMPFCRLSRICLLDTYAFEKNRYAKKVIFSFILLVGTNASFTRKNSFWLIFSKCNLSFIVKIFQSTCFVKKKKLF